MPRKLISTVQLLGSKYGRLTIIEDLGKTDYCRRVIAKCDCGIIKTYALNGLRMGGTKSCGCLNKEVASKRNKKHGLRKHLLYSVWTKMKQRCHCEYDPQYYDYGARGIYVCKEWREDFLLYYNWCIENGWARRLTIDRRNNNEGWV